MKKVLWISLLCLILTGCGNKAKEEKKSTELSKSEQEQLEKVQEDVYSVMSRMMTEYTLSELDEEPITLPFTVTCNEEKGCTYGKDKKIDFDVTPKSGTFTLKDETLLFEQTSNIIMGEYSCTIQENNIVTCKK